MDVTVFMKAWLLTCAIFMALMAIIPEEIIFFRWLMFSLVVVFWFVVALGIAAGLLSWHANITDDD